MFIPVITLIIWGAVFLVALVLLVLWHHTMDERDSTIKWQRHYIEILLSQKEQKR